MESVEKKSPPALVKDIIAGVIVFLVALPLCLGIALASGAPLFSGLIAGIVGGIVVGSLSGSQTAVSGPAAGLTAIVAAQIAGLGSFPAFLLAVVVAGVIQIGLGLAKAGALSAFFPTSVIKGLLAAIGVILILKQIPHLLGHDQDPPGEMSFEQPDKKNTFTEIAALFTGDIHRGAVAIGLLSLALLIFWQRCKPLRDSLVPAPLIVVLLGVAIGRAFESVGGAWLIENSHMVQVPVANNASEFVGFLTFPDVSQILNPAIYIGAVTIAIVASLETLLNLEAVDKLDKKQRQSPPSRELLAQGVGNLASGMIGGLPVTAVVIRGSVNVNAGAETKLSAILHGILLLFCVALLPTYINLIPLSCLAAILLVTGFKLASPQLFRQMWSEGRPQFLPFIITLLAIVFSDLLVGILIGLAVSVVFILNSNLRQPIRRISEKHLGGDVLHIQLANQVSFLNRAALESALREAPRGSHVLLDARQTDYIDPDVLGLIREFKDVTAPVYDIRVSLRGFRNQTLLKDEIQFVDFATRELQERLTPTQVLQLLAEGNERFSSGRRLDRDLGVRRANGGEAAVPMAVILSGIDSRSPAEYIFDLGLGDVYNVRVPGNVVSPRALGGIEYACEIGKAKLVLVLGHTKSNVVTHAVRHFDAPPEGSDSPNFDSVVDEIRKSIDAEERRRHADASPEEKAAFIAQVTQQHVIRSVKQIVEQSPAVRRKVDDGRIAVVGAMYDATTGKVEFLTDDAEGLEAGVVEDAELGEQ